MSYNVNPAVKGLLVSAAPNPFTGKLLVTIIASSANQAQIGLLNTNGQVVTHQRVTLGVGTNMVTLANTDDLPAGNYFLMVNTENQKQTITVVKK